MKRHIGETLPDTHCNFKDSYIVGIDPGLTGGIAILSMSGRLEDIRPMPTNKPLVIKQTNTHKGNYKGHSGSLLGHTQTRVWPYDIFRYLKRYGTAIECVVIEDVHSMPGQGVASTFNFGRSYGAVEGVVDCLSCHNKRVSPVVWKAAMNLSSNKKQSLELASKLWPDYKDTHFHLVKWDGFLRMFGL